MSKLQQIREKINLKLFESKEAVMFGLKIAGLIVSFVALVALIINYGFKLNEETSNYLLFIIQSAFAFFVFRYIIKFIYDFNPPAFLRRTWPEGIIILFLIIEGVSYAVSGRLIVESFVENFIFPGFQALSAFFIQGYLLLVVAIELGKSGKVLPGFKLHPSYIFILSFVGIILFGTLMLMLPEMTTVAGSMPFVDALFTSTSATCVTGLIVQDTATYFTFKGHLVILFLMKIGGINIVSFGLFVALLSRLGIGVKHHDVIEDFVNKESVYSAKGMLQRILIVSTLIELVGALVIYIILSIQQPLSSSADRFFFAIFHSVSAFNNAGFSTLSNGLMNENTGTLFALHWAIAILIFFGGLGFSTIFDVFSIANIKERLKYRWKKMSLSSAIALYVTLILIGAGSVLFLIFEWNGTLVSFDLFGKITTSVFQTVSLRTAGFNTIDFGLVSAPFIIFCILLMFIGGGTTSTAGGIKTSTFAIVLISALNTIRGKKNIEIDRKNIANDIVFRAQSIFIFSLGGVLTGIFLLSITEAHLFEKGFDMMDLIFEQTSAFSTVGLSTGITPYLSGAGKLIIIFSMFIGRLGTLTVAFALSKSVISTNYKYPDEHLMIG